MTEEVGRAFGAHEWRDVSFLHWRYDAAAIRPLLPAGLTVDTLDGAAWVSLVLLRMRVGPPLTRLRRPAQRVLEANLRTYVRGAGGRPGVYFFSIDCDRWTVCAGGRAVGVRYFPADAHMARHGDELHYWGRRRGRLGSAAGDPAAAAAYDVAVRPGDPLVATALDDWLTARFAVESAIGRARLRTPAAHAPWPLSDATVLHCDETLLRAAGLGKPDDDALVHYSRGVTDVVLGWPTVRVA
jgi:uncharacterized protein YqjF (DUF2071 family)